MVLNKVSEMSPNTEDTSKEIVITGMSGTFPSSCNISEFQSKLFNKTNMITPNHRIKLKCPELPKFAGVLPDLSSFDAGFFGVHHKQAECSDPTNRILIEKVVEAILDAGLHPSDLQGTNTGVFVASFINESDAYSIDSDFITSETLSWTGMRRYMQSNQVSYALKLKGPSLVVDSACSSILFALEDAFVAIKSGEMDAAIVIGAHLCLDPNMMIEFVRLGVVNMDGNCKVFDRKADGYVRSEAIGALILQRAKDAKRIYSSIVHIKTNSDGFKENGITFPSSTSQEHLLREFYGECGIEPDELNFYEAHGTGTRVGDPEECRAIDNVIGKARTKRLLIGSVKSNMGHSEPAAGLSSIVKCHIAFESGYFPPNINYTEPKDEIIGLIENRLQVVTEKTPFEDDTGLIGISSFGFGGTNGHVLLRRNPNRKVADPQIQQLPQIACVSGRTKEAVITLLNEVEQSDFDAEFIGLLHNIFRKNIQNFLYRGFIIKDERRNVQRNIKKISSIPVYLLFGEIDDWYNIKKQLMTLPPFRHSMKRMCQYLQNRGFTLDYEVSDHNNIIGPIAVLIGLGDILKLGAIQNIHIGFSYGKLISAYVDGILTMEQVLDCGILIQGVEKNNNISKGNDFETWKTKLSDISVKETLIKGLLSAVPLDIWKKITKGKSLDNFVRELGDDFDLNSLMADSVLFQVGCIYVDNNDKDLIQTQFFTSIKKSHVFSILKLLGELYIHGIDRDMNDLRLVKFPVSRGTNMISSFIKWNHRVNWRVPELNLHKRYHKRVSINTKFSEWAYVEGHMMDNRAVFGASTYLCMIWTFFSELIFQNMDDMQLIIEDCRFLNAVAIPSKKFIYFDLTIFNNGYFEVMNRETLVLTGVVRTFQKNEEYVGETFLSHEIVDEMQCVLEKEDFYKILRLRGYNFGETYQNMEKCNLNGTRGFVRWSRHWASFIDGLLQITLLRHQKNDLHIHSCIGKISIDAKNHLKLMQAYETTANGNKVVIPVSYNKFTQEIRSGFVKIGGILERPITRKKVSQNPILETYRFVANITQLSVEDSVRVNVQLLLENTFLSKVKIVEIVDDEANYLLAPIVKVALDDIPLVEFKIKILSNVPIDVPFAVDQNSIQNESGCSLVIGSRLLEKVGLLKEVLAIIHDRGCVISREATKWNLSHLPDSLSTHISILTVHSVPTETFVLFRKYYKIPRLAIITVSDDFTWLSKLQESIEQKRKQVLLLVEGDLTSGVVGLVKCLRREPETVDVKCLYVIDDGIKFDEANEVFKRQLEKNLAFNIYKNGQWGTYRHLILNKVVKKESEHFVLSPLVGDVSTLNWIEGRLRNDDSATEGNVLIQIHFCAVNCGDETKVMGADYSGIDENGKRVMGIVPTKTISSRLLADKYLTQLVPDGITLEEAATIPIAYTTAILGLIVKSKLGRGESILIHVTSESDGEAAIRLALHYNCDVFVTVDASDNRRYIKNLFPQILDNRIGYSYDSSFEKLVLRETNGRGVDVVYNSLTDEQLLASIRCLAMKGRFIEVGKAELVNNTALNLMFLDKQATYHGVVLDTFLAGGHMIKSIVNNIFCKLLTESVIKPLSRSVFEREEAEKAFKYVISGKPNKKVILKLRHSEADVAGIKASLTCNSRYYCDSSKVYVVIGGLGGFGMELVSWLVERGAKKIVINSRSGITNGYQRMKIRNWRNSGVTLQSSQTDISGMKGCQELLRQSMALGTVDGIFNLAVVLMDAMFENQSIDSFMTVFRPKATSVKWLDKISRQACPDLKTFVVFSSVSCGRGIAGQTNYGMANAVMERICELRKEEGYPAKAIQWGAIGEVGINANREEDKDVAGYVMQKISSCLNVLDRFLTEDESTIVSSMIIPEKKENEAPKDLVTATLNILGIKDPGGVDHHSTLTELGMDSMSFAEIKHYLEEHELNLNAKDIRTLTPARLKMLQDKETTEIMPLDATSDSKVGLILLFKDIDFQRKQLSNSLPKEINDLESQLKVILYPGIEGNSFALNNLAARIDAQVVCLKYPHHISEETIQELVKIIVDTIHPSKCFKFLAYSFGCIIALEVISILEAKGYHGSLVLIDTSPKLLKIMSEATNGIDEKEFNQIVITNILTLVNSQDKLPKLKGAVKSCETWEDCISLYVASRTDISSQEEMQQHITVISDIRQRLDIINNYDLSKIKIKSSIALIKSNQMHHLHLEEDYDLSYITGSSVSVIVLEDSDKSILEHPKLVEKVNFLTHNV